MYFLRFNGWDAFILSGDVVKALIREGVVDKPPTSIADMRAVQDAFNAWTKESGRPQHEVSRILSLSVGPS
jgi:3-methyladenine DNA glycosylase Tag